MTINYSESQAEHAILVKGSTTGKDAQGYRKEQADCSLSVGIMGDEYGWSPGVHYSVTVENRKAIGLTTFNLPFIMQTAAHSHTHTHHSLSYFMVLLADFASSCSSKCYLFCLAKKLS